MKQRKLSNPTTWGPEVRKTLLFVALIAIAGYGVVTKQDTMAALTGLTGLLQTVID